MVLRRLACALSTLVLLGTAAPLAAQLVPFGPEFRLDTDELPSQQGPALALADSGRLLAAWTRPGPGATDILVRSFGRDGVPAAPERAIGQAGLLAERPAVAAFGPDRFAVAWEDVAKDTDAISLRLLDATGVPLGEEIRLDAKKAGFRPRLAALKSGDLLATWSVYDPTSLSGMVMACIFGPDGQPKGSDLILTSDGHLPINQALGTFDGGFLAFWQSLVTSTGFPPPPSFHVHRFDETGQRVPPSFGVRTGEVAVAPDGRVAVAGSSPPYLYFPTPAGLDAYLQVYDAAGNPVGPETRIAEGLGDQQVEAIATDEAGRFLVVWSDDPYEDEGPRLDVDLFARLYDAGGKPLGPAFVVASETAGDQLGADVAEKDGEWVISWVSEPPSTFNGGDLVARRFATCVTDGSSLCLNGRFRAEVAWRVPASGAAGSGQGHPLTGDTGAFWFFGPENLELVVKVLDGRAVNGNFWVFYGALSNVEYDLTVTDVVSGERRVYHNPAGTMASRADTRAFPAGEGAPAAAGALAATEAPRQRTAPLTPPPCGDGPENLCLGSPWLQFDVRVAWRVPGTGETGSGKAVRLTAESGYFWFFGPENVELIVKILDGHAVNGKHWVFYGALSDVEYTITVTDKLSGKVKTYHNPAGTMASRADTAAF